MSRMFTLFKLKKRCKNPMLVYSDKAKKYLKKRRKIFLRAWSNVYSKNVGSVSYEDMESVLGRNYPKAKWIKKDDKKLQIITFLNQLGFPFHADQNYVYFP